VAHGPSDRHVRLCEAPPFLTSEGSLVLAVPPNGQHDPEQMRNGGMEPPSREAIDAGRWPVMPVAEAAYGAVNLYCLRRGRSGSRMSSRATHGTPIVRGWAVPSRHHRLARGLVSIQMV
jgi:hypothetical protein